MKKQMTIELAVKNIQRKQIRTICLITVVAIFVLALFSASLLIRNIQNGLTVTADRMGADLMLVPKGYEAEFEGVLLKSEPSSFTMDGSIEKIVEKIAGVEQCSSQLFLESLDASCCSVPVQMIAFDQEKDITISPWLENRYSKALKRGEIFVGSLVEAVAGDTLLFYGQEFTVVARMEETGTGLDASIFMTRDTAYEMCRESAGIAAQDIHDADQHISCVMVNAAADTDLQALRRMILNAVDTVDVVMTENMIGAMTQQLHAMSGILYLVILLLWLAAVVVLLAIFNAMMQERRGEFGLYRVLGFSKRKLKNIMLCESLIISVVGAALGIFLSSLLIFPFRDLIAASLHLPYLSSGAGTIVLYIVLSLVVSVVTVMVTCLLNAKRIGDTETFLLMRERI